MVRVVSVSQCLTYSKSRTANARFAVEAESKLKPLKGRIVASVRRVLFLHLGHAR